MVSGDKTLNRVRPLAGSHSVGPDVGDIRAIFSWVLARRRFWFSASSVARLGRRQPLGPNLGTIFRRGVRWGGVLPPDDDRKRRAQRVDRGRQLRGLVRAQLSGPRGEYRHHRDADCAARCRLRPRRAGCRRHCSNVLRTMPDTCGRCFLGCRARGCVRHAADTGGCLCLGVIADFGNARRGSPRSFRPRARVQGIRRRILAANDARRAGVAGSLVPRADSRSGRMLSSRRTLSHSQSAFLR